MGYKYHILASKYPYKGYSESSIKCTNIISVIYTYIVLRIRGFDIIDISARLMK